MASRATLDLGEDSGDDLFVPRPPARPSCQRLADALDSVGAVRACAEFRHDFPQPRLHIDCVGYVTLPLSADDARTIAQSATSHLSFGMTAIAVHLSNDFTINQEFNEYIQTAVDKHLQHIRLPRPLTVNVRPARLFVREPGTIGAIEELEPGRTGRHGTVAVTFPSTAFEDCQGYQNCSTRQIKQYEHIQDGPAEEPIEIRTWHHSMDDKVDRKLIAGHRLVLEYDLMSEDPDFPHSFDYDQEVDDAVAAWTADPANRMSVYPMDENRIFRTTSRTRGGAPPLTRFDQLLRFFSRAAWKHRCFVLHGIVDTKFGVTVARYRPSELGPGPLLAHIRLAPGGWSEQEIRDECLFFHYTKMICTRVEEDEILPRSFVEFPDNGWFGADRETMVLVRPEALQELAQRKDRLFNDVNLTPGILDFLMQEARRHPDDYATQKTCKDIIPRLPLKMGRETLRKIISWSLDVKAHELFDIFTARYGLHDKSLCGTNAAALLSETDLIEKIVKIANCGGIPWPETLETWNKWVLPFCLSLFTLRNMAAAFGLIKSRLSDPLPVEFDKWSVGHLMISDPAMWADLDVTDMPLLEKMLFARDNADDHDYQAHQDRICRILADRLLSMGTRRLWFSFLASLATQVSSKKDEIARRAVFCKLAPLLSKSGRNLSVRLSDFSEAQGPTFSSPKHAQLPPERRHICFDFVEIIRGMCENGMVPEVVQILRLSSAEFKDTESNPSRSDSEIVDFINALADIAWRFRESGDEPREDLRSAFKAFVLAAIKVLRNTPDVRTRLDVDHSERHNHIVETLEPLRNEDIKHLFTAREMAVLFESGDPPAAQDLAGIEKVISERTASKRKRTAEEAGLEELSTRRCADRPVGEAVHDGGRNDGMNGT